MSDLSPFECPDCGEPEYACSCHGGACVSCGRPLDDDAKIAGRDVCFACFCEQEIGC